MTLTYKELKDEFKKIVDENIYDYNILKEYYKQKDGNDITQIGYNPQFRLRSLLKIKNFPTTITEFEKWDSNINITTKNRIFFTIRQYDNKLYFIKFIPCNIDNIQINDSIIIDIINSIIFEYIIKKELRENEYNKIIEDELLKEPTIKEPTIKEPTIKEPTIKEPTIKEPTIKEPTIYDDDIEKMLEDYENAKNIKKTSYKLDNIHKILNKERDKQRNKKELELKEIEKVRYAKYIDKLNERELEYDKIINEELEEQYQKQVKNHEKYEIVKSDKQDKISKSSEFDKLLLDISKSHKTDKQITYNLEEIPKLFEKLRDIKEEKIKQIERLRKHNIKSKSINNSINDISIDDMNIINDLMKTYYDKDNQNKVLVLITIYNILNKYNINIYYLKSKYVYEKLKELDYNIDSFDLFYNIKGFNDMNTEYMNYLKMNGGSNYNISYFVHKFVDVSCSYLNKRYDTYDWIYDWNYKLLQDKEDSKSPSNLTIRELDILNNPVLLYITEAYKDITSLLHFFYNIGLKLTRNFININDIKILKKVLIELSKLIKLIDLLGYKYGFIHNDIHLSNILYDKNNGNLKLIDFGRSSFGKIINWDEKSLSELNDIVLYYIHKLYADKIYLGYEFKKGDNIIKTIFKDALLYGTNNKIYSYLICENELNHLLFIDLIPISLHLLYYFTEYVNNTNFNNNINNTVFKNIKILVNILKNLFVEYDINSNILIFKNNEIDKIFINYIRICNHIRKQKFGFEDLFEQILDGLLFVNLLLLVHMKTNIYEDAITIDNTFIILNLQHKKNRIIYSKLYNYKINLYPIFYRNKILKELDNIFMSLTDEIKIKLLEYRPTTNLFRYYIRNLQIGGKNEKRLKKYKNNKIINNFSKNMNNQIYISNLINISCNVRKKLTKKELKETIKNYKYIYIDKCHLE